MQFDRLQDIGLVLLTHFSFLPMHCLSNDNGVLQDQYNKVNNGWVHYSKFIKVIVV